MIRFLRIIVHNWPLKLAAIGLATVLYSGLVLSQDARNYNSPITIRPPSVPEGLHLLEPPPPVTSIRYFAPVGADEPGPDTFRATIDLSGIDPNGGVFDVPVQVTSVNSQIRILGVTPPVVTVSLDRLETKIVPVRVERGEIPEGLEIGREDIDPSTVTVSGPESLVRQVVEARANVIIQPSGLDVDQDVALLPVDALGEVRSPVDVTPTTARVRIPVFSEPRTRTLPINAVVTGTPASGFELATVTIEPATALVQGDADALEEITRLDTEPISVSGLSAVETFEVALGLPDGIERVDEEVITVSVTFMAVTESRTFTVGLTLDGAQPNLVYELAADRVLLAVGGSPPALDAATTGLVGRLDVAGLEPGTYDLEVAADLPSGLTLVAASPPTVTVTIAAPDPQSPPASPTATPPGS